MSRSRKSRSGLTRLLLPLGRTRDAARVGSRESPELQAIWDVIARIPVGRVLAYGDVARAAGLPGRARHVGYALRTAPAELRLPWHRVLGAGGRIAFPPASRQHREQARLLRSEGVAVRRGRVAPSALERAEP